MDRKTNRFFLLILVCSGAGIVLGGTASWAESTQCLRADAPTSQCLAQNKNTVTATLEGMSTGLVAGVSAAIAAAWQLQQED
jgi:hypothetical protein